MRSRSPPRSLLLLFVVVPRRALVVLPLAVLALLTASSVVASNRISGIVRREQANLVGPTPNWIDRAAHGDVTYLYDGEPSEHSAGRSCSGTAG